MQNGSRTVKIVAIIIFAIIVLLSLAGDVYCQELHKESYTAQTSEILSIILAILALITILFNASKKINQSTNNEKEIREMKELYEKKLNEHDSRIRSLEIYQAKIMESIASVKEDINGVKELLEAIYLMVGK